MTAVTMLQETVCVCQVFLGELSTLLHSPYKLANNLFNGRLLRLWCFWSHPALSGIRFHTSGNNVFSKSKRRKRQEKHTQFAKHTGFVETLEPSKALNYCRCHETLCCHNCILGIVPCGVVRDGGGGIIRSLISSRLVARFRSKRTHWAFRFGRHFQVDPATPP